MKKKNILLKMIFILVGLILAIYAGLRMGYLADLYQTDLIFELFDLLFEKISIEPWNLQPINFDYVPVVVFIYGLVLMLIVMGQSSGPSATMKGKEHGTAEWMNLKGPDFENYKKKFVKPKSKNSIVDPNVILSDNVKLTMERIGSPKSRKQRKIESKIDSVNKSLYEMQDQLLEKIDEAEQNNPNFQGSGWECGRAVDSSLFEKIQKAEMELKCLKKRLPKSTYNDRNLNIVIFGGSGAGKTRYYVKPNMLQANCSYIITDPKGEILEDMGEFLRRQGYDIKVINLKDQKYSDCYNPFAYLKDDSDVLIMVDTLIKNVKGDGKSDAFFDNAAKLLILSICFYLAYEAKEKDKTLANVYKMLGYCAVKEGQEKSTYERIIDDLVSKSSLGKDHPAAVQYATYKAAAGSDKTASGILTTAMNYLSLFSMSNVKTITDTDTIDFRTVGERKTAVFCIIPDYSDTYNFLISIFYTQLYQYLYFHADQECPGKKLPVHVRFILDEFANIGQIPAFAEKISTMRSRNISTTMIMQSRQQLQATYDKKADIILDNCDTSIFLGGNGSADQSSTLTYISGKLGKRTIVVENTSKSSKGEISHSYSMAGRDLMTVQELATLSGEYCIVMIRGLKPILDKKIDLLKHPNVWMCKDGNPNIKLYRVEDYFSTIDSLRKGRLSGRKTHIGPPGYKPAPPFGFEQKPANANPVADLKQVDKINPISLYDELEKMDKPDSIKLVSATDPEQIAALPKDINEKYAALLAMDI